MRRVGALIAVVAAVPLALSACGGEDEGGGQGLTIPDIQAAFDRDEPGAVTGRSATLTGEVDEVKSPSAFVVADEGEPLLVVAEKGRMPDEGDQVRVSGTVREFELSEVRKRLGADLSRPLYEEHEGEPYLWAEKVKADVGS